MASYIGFTENEVKILAERYHQNYDKVKAWYDGYLHEQLSFIIRRRFMAMMLRGEFKSYWSKLLPMRQ